MSVRESSGPPTTRRTSASVGMPVSAPTLLVHALDEDTQDPMAPSEPATK